MYVHIRMSIQKSFFQLSAIIGQQLFHNGLCFDVTRPFAFDMIVITFN